MKIAIIGKTFLKPDCYPFIRVLFEEFKTLDIHVVIEKNFYHHLQQHEIIIDEYITFSSASSKSIIEIDYFFSIGGDGTLLETVTYVKDRNIPIIGINAGRLGFLATIPLGSIKDTLARLFTKQYRLDERILVELDTNESTFKGLNFALNEFAITKRDTSSMMIIHTYVDDLFLNSYWADGLIVSTPTGSTGYSLSCGGPLVMPNTHNFIIAPINPHNLNVRPMIIPDTSTIRFQVESRSDNFLVSLDSRSKIVTSDTEMRVKQASFKVQLIELTGDNYFNTLRSKLNWGIDSRN